MQTRFVLLIALLAMQFMTAYAAPSDADKAEKNAAKAEQKADKAEKNAAKAEQKAEKAEKAEKNVSKGKTIPSAEARKQIDDVISGKVSMASLIEQLTAEDQVSFLADVNKAIADMPASIEEKTAKYLNLNHAALAAAKGSGNVQALLAETFATVPPESLTVLNERFAVDLFNRTSGSGESYTDAQYTEITLKMMEVINKRTAETDNGSTRSAFAILMFLRASNGTPEDLADKLIETLEHEDARDLAKAEWIPSALGKDKRELGYEPLLASADAGRRPDFAFVLVIAGPQYMESILEDIVGKNSDQMSFIRTRSPVLDAVENPLIHQIPTLGGDPFGGEITPEPRPYPGQ